MTFKLTDLIGPGVAVVAVAVGVWQYRLTSQSEFIRPVREAQLRLYQEASSTAAQIATFPRESSEWTKAKQEFLRLYYGPLAIVESFDHCRCGEAGAAQPTGGTLDSPNRCVGRPACKGGIQWLTS